jgi:phospholipase/lecithinase/hemolysin
MRNLSLLSLCLALVLLRASYANEKLVIFGDSLSYKPRIFGFTNSTGTAFNLTTGVVVSDPNDYVFWDGFHPTTNVHYIGAEFIFRAAFLRPQFHNFLSLQ